MSILVPTAIGICVLTIVVAGLLLLQLLANQSARQNQQQSMRIGTVLAREVASFMQIRVTLLESVAQDPVLVQIFTKRDNIALSAKESELTYLFPGASRVRLLYPGTNQTEEEAQPPLGYAALNMLREVEAGRTPPAEVHISSQGNRNIAITRPVRSPADKHVLGHLLVQFSLDHLTQILDPMARDGNSVVLSQRVNQNEVKLYQKGNSKETAATAEIPGTRWRLSYFASPNDNSDEDWTFRVEGLLGTITLVVVLVLFGIYRVFTKALNSDLVTIVNFCKDLRDSRVAHKYPVNFAAVNGTLEVIQRLLQASIIPVATVALVKQELKPSLTVPPIAVSADLGATPPLPLVASSTLKSAPSSTPVRKDISSAVPPSVATPVHLDMDLSEASEMITLESNLPADIPAATPKAVEAPATAQIELIDLSALSSNLYADPSGDDATPPPVSNNASTMLSLPGLTFLDSDLSDLTPENKSTIALPSTPVSASPRLDLLETGLHSPDANDATLKFSSSLLGGESIPPSDEIFRMYDIRGVVGDSLTDDATHEIGRAIGSEAQERNHQSVIVARDGRISSPRLAAALIRGMRATGCNVIDIGEVPTPVMHFATHFLETHAGVMLTASHNPSQWNGMKVVLGGETIFSDEIQKLRQRIEARQFMTGEGNLQGMNVVPDYLAQINADIQLARPLRIVVDCGNGVTGSLAPRLYRGLGCEVEELFCVVDGNFPNHSPDPGEPGNLRDLIGAVKTHQADLGIAMDGDGDRMVAVAGNGAIIWPDRLMMLFAEDVLSRNPGSTVVFDVKSSSHLARIIKKHGGRPLMWKTGYSLIRAKMKEVGALLAGEINGHYFFKERWFGFDDGLYAGARLLELVSHDQRAPGSLFADLPDTVTTPELRLDLPEGESKRLMKSLAVARTRISGAEITHVDGLRADFEEGWGLVRSSSATPSLIFRFEANNPRILRRIQDEFRRILLEVGPGLKLPF
ncbi:phosphomannomutase / phosphoglucomutase [Gammaproteobacteria bacterium]